VKILSYKLIRIFLLWVFCLLSSCMVGPDYEKPKIPLPNSWYQGNDKSIEFPDDQTELFAELQWWDIFQDETLNKLINAALKNNRDLKKALLNIEKARATHQIEGSILYPSVDLRQEIEREGLSTLEDGTDDIAVDQHLAFDLAWEVDLWGANRRKSDAAFADYLGSGYGWRSVRLTLISDVASTYFELLGAKEQLLINITTLAARKRSFEIAEKRFKGGLTSKLEVQQAKVELASAKVSVPGSEWNLLSIENRLSILLDVNPREYNLTAQLEQQHIPEIIKPGLPSNLLQRRPDIMRTEQALRIATEQVGIAKAAFFPSLKLTSSVGFETVEFEDLLDSDGKKWIIESNLLFPIFHAGRLNAQFSVAEIELKKAKLAYEQSVLQSMREVSDALKHFYKSKEILQAHLELVEASNEYYVLAMKRYRIGILAYLDVLDAQRKLLDAQLKVSSSRESQLQSMVSLYKALGGGWEEDDIVTQEIVAQQDEE